MVAFDVFCICYVTWIIFNY